MKKLLYAVGFAALLASCSGNDDDNNSNPDTILVKKMVFAEEGGSYSTTFTYNGTKLTRLTDSDGSYSNFTYTGDLITKVEEFDSETDVLLDKETYEYNAAGQLVKYTDENHEDDVADISVYTFVHNANGSILFSQEPNDPSSESTYNGTFTANQYVEHYTDFGDTFTTTFTFDNKNNPLKNITGYDKVYFADTHNPLNFANNILTETHSEGSERTSTYTYNAAGFPLVQSKVEYETELSTVTYTYN